MQKQLESKWNQLLNAFLAFLPPIRKSVSDISSLQFEKCLSAETYSKLLEAVGLKIARYFSDHRRKHSGAGGHRPLGQPTDHPRPVGRLLRQGQESQSPLSRQ